METNILIPSIPAIAGLSFAALIVFVIAAIQESKHDVPTSDIVRRGYVYLVSFVTLLIASAALASLLNTGLRSTFFKQADVLPVYKMMPPSLYIPPTAAQTEKGMSGLTCASGCTLTADQKDSITAWAAQYKDWKRTSNASFQRNQDIVTAISFLAIAVIVFAFHWVLANRDKRQTGPLAMRITYLWAFSFLFIITSVVSAAFLLNTTLKTVFLHGEDTSTSVSSPVPVASERSSVDSVVTCGSTCGLSAATVNLAQEWQAKYSTYMTNQQENTARRNRDNAFAMEIAFLVVALPLFGYHFRTVWKETRTKKPKARK